jgi:hypothetical protein
VRSPMGTVHPWYIPRMPKPIKPPVPPSSPTTERFVGPGPPIGDSVRFFAPGWVAIYTVVERDGVAVIAEIMITPEFSYLDRRPLRPEQAVPPGGLTANLLRKVPTGGDVIADAVKTSGSHPIGRLRDIVVSTAAVDGAIVYTEHEAKFSDAAVKSAQRSRGHARDPLFLAEVANSYLSLLGSGRDVIGALREKLADQEIFYSDNGVRELLRNARGQGLLTEAPPGRAGGRLTPRAMELLSEGEPSAPSHTARG